MPKLRKSRRGRRTVAVLPATSRVVRRTAATRRADRASPDGGMPAWEVAVIQVSTRLAVWLGY